MTKYFKNKKIMRRKIIIKYIFVLFVAYLTIRFCMYILFNTNIAKKIYSKDKLNTYINTISNNTINKPTRLLNYKSNNIKKEIEILPIISTNSNIKRPIVYIYNTYQTETYSDLSTNVINAAYLLKDALNKQNIDVIIEESSINDFLVTNNMDYSYSYVASRYFIKDNIINNNYDLIIDLHRDALKREDSIINIEGIIYAKTLFVVGMEHDNYLKNLELSNTLNDLINSKYPYLSRGVMLKSGPDVNGLYNQDLSNRMILLELGSNNNNIEEITNTINAVSIILGEYLYGNKLYQSI